jgi:hypothetical protein
VSHIILQTQLNRYYHHDLLGLYDCSLAHTLCHKYGYGDDFERFKREASDKFSLLNDGTLKKGCTRLLLVNGTEDEIFPVDDYYLCLQYDNPKEARCVYVFVFLTYIIT